MSCECWYNSETGQREYCPEHEAEAMDRMMDIEELREQLADERAKVAQLAVVLNQADPALRMAKRVLNDESELGDIEASFVATEMIDKALAALQSTDALADIRREVARECAEIAERESEDDKREREANTEGSMEWIRWHWRSVEAEYIAEYIRAKFGVAE